VLNALFNSKTMIQEFGYDYDAIGNMAYRSKTLPGGQQLKEEFWYDQLNRLTDIKLNGQPTGGHDYDPQGLGNIKAKTAYGQQIYSNAEYGEGDFGPHAITSAVNTANAFPIEEQIAEYTSYEQLKSLTQGALGLSITYGHHHQRIKQEHTVQKNMIRKLWAGACEYITQNGQTTTLTYLSSPDGLYGLHRILPDGSENIHYLHTDHTSTALSTGLGSWTAVTDETGTVIDEQSYDAWGNRRNPETWRAYTSTPASPLFDRGFTGHEHLDGFQLINMNGRMYDPVVSRMLAPDNFVQTPDFSQNFNRYSYALNNPLMFTDPSGELFGIDDAIVITALAIIGAYTGGVGRITRRRNLSCR
jgi:RHS repeat-associated protein